MKQEKHSTVVKQKHKSGLYMNQESKVKITSSNMQKNLNWSGGWRYLLPVQAVDHLSHSVDEILVFLRVTDNDAMELLHVGINGFKSGCLATACRPTRVCFSGQICSQKSTDMTKYVSQARIDNTSKIYHIVVG